MPDTIVEKTEGGVVKRYRVVEHAVDPPNTFKRYLVPVDTDENDIPVGSVLLDENETAGLLARQARPEKILKGDMVRRKDGDTLTVGTVDSIFKSGKIKVNWDDNTSTTHQSKELNKVY